MTCCFNKTVEGVIGEIFGNEWTLLICIGVVGLV